MKVADAEVWDIEDPVLYKLHIFLQYEAHILDEMEIPFGFRQTAFKADGFYLNGRKVKLCGVTRGSGLEASNYKPFPVLEETDAIITEAVNEGKLVARVHTGDPSIYGAIAEQIRELKKHDIEYEIIPGVSSLFGTASVLEAELTLPEISQSVIITRPEGRTPKPAGESIASFSKHHATMCIFLGIGMIDKVVDELLEGYEETTPVAVVKKAAWPDQQIIRGTLKDIAEKVKDALVMVSSAAEKQRCARFSPEMICSAVTRTEPIKSSPSAAVGRLMTLM
jgi:precorrin-4 C11-methyltransferase